MNCTSGSHLLVFPRLRVQNANAISSPLTHGFPSMTAFLGVMWALERKLQQAGLDLPMNAIGVVCHDHQEQVTEGGFVKTFRLTRNPVDKAGKTAAIVEEGRIHLEVSLVISINTESWREEYLVQVAETLASMRIAGGTIHPQAKSWLHRYQPKVVDLSGDEASRLKKFRELSRSLLPGFTLVARDDLLDKRLSQLQTENPNATRLDAWLSLSRVDWHYQADAENGKGKWQPNHTSPGWIVPIPVGYGALGEVHEPGTVANARDNTTPFRFVESLYSVGQWLSPHRLHAAEQLLWYADSQPENGIYRCRNDYENSLTSTQNSF
ncbi:type I-F CRISPR-associated protein Csy2 [Cellvibrio polysaccharolyticus]|uniref:Type I-F CRISPR-associated protein Csy2 n=1 Tax=Cellvibrio polysaccharolyticus TaxID=2082724 RepID=A0A928V227_9GAMM|nr:type I-F CRISPR-associated protein Csy2 [Cellvibrio polysaccharolyticus]MBE8717361.1 type I-F CRISPR-associated protein Csy2 [Cellvibrio polysaccharolyticus]